MATGLASAQEVELTAVQTVLQTFHDQALNFYSDSHYVVRAMELIETVSFISTVNSVIQGLFVSI